MSVNSSAFLMLEVVIEKGLSDDPKNFSISSNLIEWWGLSDKRDNFSVFFLVSIEWWVWSNERENLRVVSLV